MIHWVDDGFDYEYCGQRGYKAEWFLEDDYGQGSSDPEPYYVTICEEKNGKKQYYECFVDADHIIESLRDYFPEKFYKEFDKELGEEVERFDGFDLEEIIDDPALVCSVYSDPVPSEEDDYWDRVDYEYERYRDSLLENEGE